MVICLWLLYGCFQAAKAEVYHCGEDCRICQIWNTYYLDLYRKRLQSLDLEKEPNSSPGLVVRWLDTLGYYLLKVLLFQVSRSSISPRLLLTKAEPIPSPLEFPLAMAHTWINGKYQEQHCVSSKPRTGEAFAHMETCCCHDNKPQLACQRMRDMWPSLLTNPITPANP